MTETPQGKMAPATGLTPGHWIAIATIAVGILGGVISVALGEHNARVSNIETAITTVAETQARMAEALVRMEGETKATRERVASFEEQVNNRFDQNDERLNRIETSIDRLIPATSGRPDDAACRRTRRIAAEPQGHTAGLTQAVFPAQAATRSPLPEPRA